MGCTPNPAVKIPSTFRNTSIYFNSRMWPRNLRKPQIENDNSILQNQLPQTQSQTTKATNIKRPGAKSHPDWFDKQIPSML